MTEIKNLQDNLVMDGKLSKEEFGALETLSKLDAKDVIAKSGDLRGHLVGALSSELSRIEASGKANPQEVQLLKTILSKLSAPLAVEGTSSSGTGVVGEPQQVGGGDQLAKGTQSPDPVNKLDSNKKEVSLNLSEGGKMKEFKATFQKNSDESVLVIDRPLGDLTVKGKFEESDITKINDQLNRKMLSPFSTEYSYIDGKLSSSKNVEKGESVKTAPAEAESDAPNLKTKDAAKENEFKETEVAKTDIKIDYSTGPVAHNARLVTNKDKGHDLVIDRTFPLGEIRVQGVGADLLKDDKKDDLSNLVNYITKNHSDPSLLGKSIKYEDTKK